MQNRIVDTKKLVEAYREVFEGEAGGIVLADLLRKFGYVDRSMFHVDGMVMAHCEGQRAVLQEIQKYLINGDQLIEVEGESNAR